ncbi:MAG TPA: hypothetical protein VGO93_11480 [Candidatus Xenobia bacterium]
MSDSIGKVASASQVSSTSSVGAVRNDALSEVQAYNLKAIGPNQPVASGDGAFEVPLAGAVTAFAGDPATAAMTGTTRSALASSSVPTASVGNVPAHDMDIQTAPGNPYMAPPPAPSHTPPPAAASAQTTSVTPTDDDDAPKQPWHADSNPVTYRDFDFDERDNRPNDTWAPNSNRSAEFAALDNMKLTSPEEALAQWRSQKERAAQSSPAPVQASSPAPAQASSPIPTQASSTQTAYAPAPAATPANPTAPGNPFQKPPTGLVMPPSGPPASAQAFSTPSPAGPVDLSSGSYVNPNLSSNQSMSAPTPAMNSNPPFRPANIMPNLPGVTEPQQGMVTPQPYQNRFQAMVSNLSMGGVAGMGMPGMGMPGMMRMPGMGMPGMGMPGMGVPGMGMSGMGMPGMMGLQGFNSPAMNLFGDDDSENDAANDGTFGLFGNGNKRRSGPGSNMLWQMGGFGE